MIDHDEAVALARRVLSLRLQRADHLPKELLGEPGWGLLLALFIADADGEALTVAAAATRAGAIQGTAERWLKVLQSFGLAACPDTCSDGQPVGLTPKGVDAVERCMEDAKLQMKPV